eukprot:Skav213505  [mRNA]  locus=scaffold3849:268322:291457:- [translate_table: standard]
MDHHDADTLVVGPAMDGHRFRPGERILDGRTSPWNTLALWSVRKLALTGFLCIADGLPDVPDTISLQSMSLRGMPSSLSSSTMGSHNWWNGEDDFQVGFARQMTDKQAPPAGVEEVTAIALLQHLHGSDRARAVLLQLPDHLEAQMSWSANWGKDEARQKWHKYKMASKVARPAAQLQELFKLRTVPSTGSVVGQEANIAGEAPDCFQLLRRRKRADTGEEGEQEHQDDQEKDAGNGSVHVGKVMHYGESIMPPVRIDWICLVLCLIFYANSTSVLATAFSWMNAKGPGQLDQTDVAFVAFLIGGIYLPMPLSLWLSRTVTVRFGHRYGLLLFLFFQLLGHLLTVCCQAIAPHTAWPVMLARLVHGLGSGILFQTRHILATLSTNDNHTKIQTWIFFTGDLGLAVGALFPVMLFAISGGNLPKEAPELIPSAVSLCIELMVMLWVGSVFPSRLNGLPEGVRFTDWTAKGRYRSKRAASDVESDRKFRLTVWLSGTMRIFVQSAMVPVVALSMRDANWTGNFRQTLAVASLFLLPLPFEAIAGGSVSCSSRDGAKDGTTFSKILSGAIGCAALLVAGLQPQSADGDGELLTLLSRIFELGILMVALGMAAPYNAAKLYQQKDAEHSIVVLEWLKAYVGRLLGPFCAVLLYSFLGYGPVLAVLALATAVGLVGAVIAQATSFNSLCLSACLLTRFAMKCFARAALALVMLMPVMSLRGKETGEDWSAQDRTGVNALERDPKDDGRVSYYCAPIGKAEPGDCNWIKEEDKCNERTGICTWKPFQGRAPCMFQDVMRVQQADNFEARLASPLLPFYAVQIMDAHKGFDIITAPWRHLVQQPSFDPGWDQPGLQEDEFRRKLGGLVVVASNAGGAWTPMGLVGTLGWELLQMKDEKFERPKVEGASEKPPVGQAFVFWGGLAGMIFVPVFSGVTQSGMMLNLGCWVAVVALALFFLGVLFAVGGLERVGILKACRCLGSLSDVAILLGFASAVVDNVPLVAASQGMYDLTQHPPDDALWNLITYCAATGGSLLVIGSAAGVAFMGMAIGPAALVGYFFGVAGMMGQQAAGLAPWAKRSC